MNEYEQLGYIEAAIINLTEQLVELKTEKKFIINKIKENANKGIYFQTGRENSHGEQSETK